MTPERWQRLKEVFFRAIDCPPGDERQQLVSTLCEGDPDLESDLRSLLDHADDGILRNW
jgi:hypothetical protein